jgi:hypothetical protein
MREALARRDMAAVYRLLQRYGMSQRRIAAWTEQSQSEISEILGGRQVTAASYDVLSVSPPGSVFHAAGSVWIMTQKPPPTRRAQSSATTARHRTATDTLVAGMRIAWRLIGMPRP